MPQERDGRRRHHQEPNLMESTTEASSSAIRQESTAVKWTRRAFRRKEKEKCETSGTFRAEPLGAILITYLKQGALISGYIMVQAFRQIH